MIRKTCLLATLLLPISAHAATVIWTASAFDNVNQLSTVGNLVEAYDLGSSSTITLNGIDFAAATTVPTSLSAPAGTPGVGTLATLCNEALPANAVTGLTTTQVGTLMDSFLSVGGIGNNRLTISGLTDGQQYLFEFLAVDNRTNPTMDVGYDTTKTLSGTSIADVKLFSGSFIASGTTQTMLIADNGNSGNNVTFSAYQLRAVPEPSVALLGGFGLLSLLRRRRN